MISQEPRAFPRLKGKRKKKRREKVSRPRSRRGSSMKRSLTVRVRYTMIKREFYETRNRETGPRPCRGCASRHPRNVDPGQGTFLFIFRVRARNFSGKPTFSVLFDRTLNSNSFHDRVFFFPSRFLFSFFLFYCNDCSFFLIYRMLFLCVTRENWRREISFQIFVLYWIIVMCCYKCEL